MNIAKQTLWLETVVIVLMTLTAGLAQETGTPPPATSAAQATTAPVAPPSAAPKRSAAELETLVGPIALYPDPLIATILPASVYPLEIVQAARFMSDTNNVAKLDEQPWDDNVKAVARIPDALKKLNEDISWTIQLGEAFLAQDKDVMDTIQALRLKAQKAGTLQTTEQQIVSVTNTVVETVVEQQAVIVTNTIVEIVSSNPEVVYVPQYVPSAMYYPPPYYVYDPYAPLLTFTAGVAMGAIIANNCDWHGGGCYHGGDVDIDIDSNRNVNRNTNRNTDRAQTRSGSGQGKKWQPDQSRLNKSGAAGATSARSQEARGYGNSGARPSTGAAGNRPSTGAAGARPSTGTGGARPSTGTKPSTGGGPDIARGSGGSPSTANRPSPSSGAAKPSASPASRPSTSSAGSRPSSSNNAFSGGSSSKARSSSSRGSASRGGGGGGGRGGGGRR